MIEVVADCCCLDDEVRVVRGLIALLGLSRDLIALLLFSDVFFVDLLGHFEEEKVI